ncbi:helix-turn-helix domain-containing protein [Micromonospora sp. Mcm103]|uniref:helix-turn-helix domain-containing protein n=1 Tax=Micromonospora sp. Mcm103 TaxID=2926015 RepID=UPI0021C87126|nr:helix-turn-helix domain-containing protein [Micromonospora sp. Mcm103]
MTQPELEALPVAFDLVVAARAFGMGRTKAYDLAKRGDFPCRVLKIGNSYRVTRADLLRALGINDQVQAVA